MVIHRDTIYDLIRSDINSEKNKHADSTMGSVKNFHLFLSVLSAKDRNNGHRKQLAIVILDLHSPGLLEQQAILELFHQTFYC